MKTDDDGEALSPPGTVYGACLNGTSPNRIEIDNLRLKQQRLEFASGDTTTLEDFSVVAALQSEE